MKLKHLPFQMQDSCHLPLLNELQQHILCPMWEDHTQTGCTLHSATQVEHSLGSHHQAVRSELCFEYSPETTPAFLRTPSIYF